MGTRTVTSKLQSHSGESTKALASWRTRHNRLLWIGLAALALMPAILIHNGTLIVGLLAIAVFSIAMAATAHAPVSSAGNIMVIGHGAQAAALAAALSIEPLRPAQLARGVLKTPSSGRTAEVIHIPTLDEAKEMLPRLRCDRIVLADGFTPLWAIPADVRGVEPRVVASSLELQRILGRVPIETLDTHYISLGNGSGSVHAVVKRILDLIVAIPLGILVVALLPLMALAIRLDSPGPVFYSQIRLGLDGQLFRIHKFRSMRRDAEANGAAWALTNDSRVTRVGSILRSTRIDELPQVWNILRGEMTLIGPRPERPEFAEVIEQQLPSFRLRTRVKPGITGWAQICAGYGRSINDARTKLEYDLFYVAHTSLLFDLRILLKTIPVVIGRKGS